MSITVSISTVQSHTPDADADEMSNSRRSSSLISVSVGVGHPCCRKPQRSLRSFSLTGTIFLSIPSLFARIQSSSSQYFTSSNHLLCGFYLNFSLKACFKSPSSSDLPLRPVSTSLSQIIHLFVASGPRSYTSPCSSARLLVKALLCEKGILFSWRLR